MRSQIFERSPLLPKILRDMCTKNWAAYDQLGLWTSNPPGQPSWEATFWHSDLSNLNREVKVIRVPEEFNTNIQ